MELVSILTAKYQVKKNKTGLTAVFRWIIYLLSRYFQRRIIFFVCVCVGGFRVKILIRALVHTAVASQSILVNIFTNLKMLLLLPFLCLIFAEIVIRKKMAQYTLRLKHGIMTEAAGQHL